MTFSLKNYPKFREEVESTISDLNTLLNEADNLVSADLSEGAKVAGIQALVNLYLPE